MFNSMKLDLPNELRGVATNEILERPSPKDFDELGRAEEHGGANKNAPRFLWMFFARVVKCQVGPPVPLHRDPSAGDAIV
jgi:hypothetical protein